MATALKTRLRALEAIRRAAEPAAPILVLLPSMDRDAAIARFVELHGHPPAETLVIGRRTGRLRDDCDAEGPDHG